MYDNKNAITVKLRCSIKITLLFTFFYSYMVEKILLLGKIFENEILTDYTVCGSLNLKISYLVIDLGACVSVMSITHNQTVAETLNLVLYTLHLYHI